MNAKTNDDNLLKPPLNGIRRFRRWLVTGIVISVALIAAGSLCTYYLGEFAKKDLIKEGESVLATAALHLSAETDKVEDATKALSYSPVIVPALISRNARDIENASRALDRYNKTLRLSVTYLLDTEGMTIASSNRRQADSFIGKSYKFRPYFSQAIGGQAATYFARGVTSDKRGFYASTPILHKGKIIGVVVIKQDIDDIGTYIRKLNNCFFISREGVIFLASRPELLFKSLWPLDDKTKKKLSASRQFGDGPFAALLPREFSAGEDMSYEGDNYLLLRKKFNAEGWSIVLLAPTKNVFIYKTFGVIITLLILTIFLVLFIFLYLNDKALQREIKLKDGLLLLTDDLKGQRDLLKRSEERYRNLFENAGEAILVAQDFMFKFANPKAEELLGWPQEMISAKSIGDFIHPDDRQMVIDRHAGRLKGEDPAREYSFRVIDKNGKVKWVELRVARFSWEEKPAILCFMTDITMRKQADAALLKTLKDLQEAKEHFEAIFNTSPDAVQITRLRDGMIVNVNDGFTTLSGFTRAEAIGKTSFEINGWKNVADRQKLITELSKKGFCENLEAPFQIKDGSQKMGSVSAKIILLQGEPHMLSVIRDITEHKREEEALKQSEDRYRSLFDSAHDAIILMDRNIIIDCNARAAELFRCPKEQMIGNTTTRFWPERQADGRLTSEVALEHIKKALKNERSSNEVRHMRADGTLVDTDVTLNYFEMNGKKYSQAIIRDITERKQAEAALLKTLKDLQETRNMLIQSEKFAAVGKLAAGAAHEINNPMNILSMRMQLMEITDPLTEMQQTSIDICRKQVARVVKIIKGLEVFSRTGQVKQVREDLNGLIKNILDLSSPRLKLENISANLDLDEEIPLANLDKDKIEQVLLILINNAADALAGKDKKILRITTNNIIGDDGEKRARLIVADNGYGIPEDNILRVFDPFFTTKDPDKGTGMGLSIAYRIVHDHGGTISVKNNEWGGASFVVELPVG